MREVLPARLLRRSNMYNAFFGFTQNPFNMSPDPSFLFRSPQHEEALASLMYGVQSRKGFIALTGEVGTGKTTMLECLRDFLNAQQIAFASLFNSRLTVEQFFEFLAYDLDLRCNRLSKTEVLLSLNNMLAGARRGGPHHGADRGRSPQSGVGCSGRDPPARQSGESPRQTAADHSCRASRNWIANWKRPNSANSNSESPCAVRCAGFSAEETRGYINSRMARAGLKNQTIVGPQLLDEIHFRSQGIPRLINAVCDNLLLTAFAMETRVATLEMLDEVTADMRLEYPGQESLPPGIELSEQVIRRPEVRFRGE